MFESSQLRIISVGIVAADKEDGSRFIEVYPIELLPFIEGGITTDMYEVITEGLNLKQEPYSITLHRMLSVKADWIGSTHRITSPNVKAGEQVKLWTIGNSERYYWESMGRDDKQRTREKVTFAFASRDKGNSDLTNEDSYNFTVDTINKHVTFETSKVDGEYCRYLFQFNTGDGNITAQDDLGNIIQLDSRESKITLQNKESTFLTLNKKDIELYAPHDYIANYDNDSSITVGRDWIESVGRDKKVTIGNDSITTIANDETTTVGNDSSEIISGNKNYVVTKDIITAVDGNITTSVLGNVTETITGSKTTNAATTSETASTITKTGVIGLIGPVTISGPLSMAPGGAGGGATLQGDMSMTGDFSQSGNMDISGDMSTSGSADIGGSLTCADLVTPTWNGIPQADHLKDT